MALTAAQKKALTDKFKTLTKDEQDALREAAGVPDDLDLRSTVETLQKEIEALKKEKGEGEKGILERLFG